MQNPFKRKKAYSLPNSKPQISTDQLLKQNKEVEGYFGKPKGFAAMSKSEQRRIASLGGHASSGNFKNDPKRAAEAGRKGAANQPLEAKILGGKNSWKNRKK